MKQLKTFEEFISMKVEGVVLNVGDGDAIILTLEKQNEKILVVIDGADTSYANYVCERVQSKCTELNKEGPDLIVCTHYDSDHIAGIIEIVKHFREKIGMIWVHKLPKTISENVVPASELLENARHLSAEAEALRIIQLSRHDPDSKFSLLLESIRQLNLLDNLIEQYGIRRTEPFANDCSYDGWGEIVILGPTKEYFNSLFAEITFNEFISSEHSQNLIESADKVKRHVSDPCRALKTKPLTNKSNLASVIIRIDVGYQKLLFTGDAGVDSFRAASGYPDSITGMTFLKIPHHGSSNNINKEIIDLIDPKYAYNSGADYEDPKVIDCLKTKKGRQVKTTRKDGDLDFSFSTT